jgi:hypothetical protein
VAAAGLPAGVLPSAALQPGRLPSAAAQQQQAGRSGAAVGPPTHAWQDEAGDPLSLSLAARLQQQQQQQPTRHDERDVHAALPQRTQRGQHAPQSPPADGVIDLLSDASPSPRPRRRRSPPPLPSRFAAAAAAAAGGLPPWDLPLPAGAPTHGAAAVGSSVLDEQVAVMVGMGYSGKKARRVSAGCPLAQRLRAGGRAGCIAWDGRPWCLPLRRVGLAAAVVGGGWKPGTPAMLSARKPPCTDLHLPLAALLACCFYSATLLC